MKTKLTSATVEPKEFKPFTIEITVETIQEARALFHVANHVNAARIVYDDYEGLALYSQIPNPV